MSQPQETMMGLLLLGEKRTQDTHSLWLSSCRRRHIKSALRQHLPVLVIHLNMEFNIALVVQWWWDCWQQSSAPHLPGWCICTPQVCSRAWWSCRENQTRSDGCQQKRPRSRHPWCVRQTSELSGHCGLRLKKKIKKIWSLNHSSWLHKSLPKMKMHHWRTYLSN